MAAHRAAPRHRAVRSHRMPVLLGTAGLLVLAAAAGPGLGTPVARPDATWAAVTSVADGTDATGWTDTRLDRQRVVATSRDSERQALQDAAGTQLSPVGEAQQRESNAALKALGRQAELAAGQLPASSWHLPTRGYHLTARFGQAGGHWVSNHTGLDFAAPTGTPIYAVASGAVTETGWAGAYGNRTVETLPDGTELWYCHQSAIGVKVGQQVLSGQAIGAVGSTGNTTGPHVHLEVRPGGGDPVDPYQALVVHGVRP